MFFGIYICTTVTNIQKCQILPNSQNNHCNNDLEKVFLFISLGIYRYVSGQNNFVDNPKLQV